MITQISVQPISESSEKGTCGQEVILIILKELLDLLFERSLKQSFNPSFGVFTLNGKLSSLGVLLPIRLFDYVWDLMHDPHFFIVVKIGGYVFGYCYKWHWILSKSVTHDIHLHIRLIGWVLS